MAQGKVPAPRPVSVKDLLGELELLASHHGMDANNAARLAQVRSGGCRLLAEARGAGRERRRFTRYSLMHPAVAQIHQDNHTNRYASCTISDLSFSGVQVLFPISFAKTFLARKFNGFELLFSLPEKNRSVCLRCRLVRLQVTPDHSIVGARCDNS